MPFERIQLSAEGVKEMRNKLAQLSAEAQQEAVVDAATSGGEFMYDRVLEKTPVEAPGPEAKHPGLLKSDMKLSVKKSQPGVAQANVGPGKKGYYAFFLEFGTRFMAARPFMRPVYDAYKAVAGNIMITRFEAFLNRRLSGG